MVAACDFRPIPAAGDIPQNLRMTTSWSLQGLFRAAGLVTCATIGLPLALDMWLAGPAGALKDAGMPLPADPAAAQRAWAALMGFWAVSVVIFGVCFWLNTLPSFVARFRRLKVALLALQSGLGAFVWTDFLAIVAAEIPFVLTGRRAVAWLGLQSALFAFQAWRLAGSAVFVPLPRSSHLPPGLAAALTVVGGLAWHGLFFCVGFIAATEGRRRREMARLNADLEATRFLLAESSRLAERLHLARELHDGAGHALALLNVKLEIAQQKVSGEPADDAVREARAASKELFRQVREIVGQLRDERPLDLPRALARLVAGVAEPRVALDLAPELPPLDPARAHALFRCVQEIVTNAVRHAAARTLTVAVRAGRDGNIALEARDDGRGSRQVTPGTGLRGLRERIEALGGTVAFETAPGRGFQVRASLPPPTTAASAGS